jgi:hypothetical protein
MIKQPSTQNILLVAFEDAKCEFPRDILPSDFIVTALKDFHSDSVKKWIKDRIDDDDFEDVLDDEPPPAPERDENDGSESEHDDSDDEGL